ncbi:glucan 1,4-alpha-glucosidase [Niveispirillum sp. BGYR6]|uniref:glucan 1,4-alpha-glucosidase n=1 Tax=Niveispirillum sp. BGYR6 TaxID=2971249 RepID=UPI0022B99518|nr:glucan 1,4-alpha-glucosidase [Niveispirillum sp. BGYR6]MDG5496548.1 glucan 1,4-alpha-glucosidase [Niveispirillum sp. BGYR6]
MNRKMMARQVLGPFAALLLAGTSLAATAPQVAPGAPGAAATWAYSGKTGIGTSYESYQNGRYQDGGATGPVSRVWFSLAHGIVTETMRGQIHEAQLRELQFAIQGDGFLHLEAGDMDSHIDYLHQDAQGRPLSLAYRIINRDRQGRYEVEKHIFTDPDRDVLFIRTIFRALTADITPVLLADPQMAGTGGGDRADSSGGTLNAWEGANALSIRSATGFTRTSVGFVGASDGLTGLRRDGVLPAYQTSGTRAGNVALAGELPKVAKGTERVQDIVIGFGADKAAAAAAADASLRRGYSAVLAAYNGEGDAVGWEDYLASLAPLPDLAATATDGGKLAYVSAMVLKAQEDKTHAGALIASLSAPWGDTVSAETFATGYKAVWPRDFYQCAMALLALGDKQTPLAAFNYLKTIQVRPDTKGNKGVTGWFLQKTHVDGTREWVAVQLDQTAMPIMLGWKLAQAGVLDKATLNALWADMLKPAADFLVTGGKPGIDWNNKDTVTPPATQQERWEEQGGYSPSTTAAVVAGLVAAAEIAEGAGDPDSAARYREKADAINARIEATMFTTSGPYKERGGNGRYFLRITQNDNPNDKGPLTARNGKQALTEDIYLDAGFLELVRYGVRRADAPSILDSLPELDDTGLPDEVRVKYLFKFPGDDGTYPGWRRYGNDGYGEDVRNGANYGTGELEGGMGAGQRGRVWPIFTGERGHYELAAASLKPGGATPADIDAIRRTYARGMEKFANEGLMIPEQVWDGVGVAPPGYSLGQGTNSATPLAWSHAEYVKLLRSLHDRRVWDWYAPVAARYAK